MDNSMICVENLGKRYRIGVAQRRHDTLRDALVAGLRAPLEWLRDHTYFWLFLSAQYRLLEVRMGRREAIPVFNPPSAAAAYFPLQEDDPQWDVAWEPIQDMATLAGEHGSEFLLIVLPTAFQVQDAAYSRVPQQVLGKRAREDRIEVLDLLPVFREACREAPPGRDLRT